MDFTLEEATIDQIGAALRAQRTTALGLVRAYGERIESIDRAGPTLRSVIELNPEAEAIAQALDDEARSGRWRGPLHGVPILVKDNIASADRMQTSAGSPALVGAQAPRDAFVVQRLRAAGAVLLGKANLSEWANIRGQHSISGWSTRGGQTLNPYALDRSPSGSSSGSGVAVAANLCAASVRHRDRRLDHVAVFGQRTGRPEAHRRCAEPRRHRADLVLAGHAGPDVPHGARRRAAAGRHGRRRRARRRHARIGQAPAGGCAREARPALAARRAHRHRQQHRQHAPRRDQLVRQRAGGAEGPRRRDRRDTDPAHRQDLGRRTRRAVARAEALDGAVPERVRTQPAAEVVGRRDRVQPAAHDLRARVVRPGAVRAGAGQGQPEVGGLSQGAQRRPALLAHAGHRRHPAPEAAARLDRTDRRTGVADRHGQRRSPAVRRRPRRPPWRAIRTSPCRWASPAACRWA